MGPRADQDGAGRGEREPGPNAADFSEALARGLAVIDAFAGDRRPLTQAELSRRLDLPRATVRRAVVTLEHLGYLTTDGRSCALSPRVLRLASGYLTSNVVSTVLQPACDRICARFHETCSVAVLDGPDTVLIARAVPNRLLAVGSGVGDRVVALDSALGTVLLADLDPAGSVDRPASSDAAATGGFDTVREQGFCYVAHRSGDGLQSVAVPLRRWDGRTVAALSLDCTVEGLSPAAMTGEVLDALRAEARELARQLV